MVVTIEFAFWSDLLSTELFNTFSLPNSERKSDKTLNSLIILLDWRVWSSGNALNVQRVDLAHEQENKLIRGEIVRLAEKKSDLV